MGERGPAKRFGAKTVINLTETVLQELQEEAKRRNTSVSVVVRDAISQYFNNRKSTSESWDPNDP